MGPKSLWFVSRQRYWPDGENVVEIAYGGQDYANPDMLSPIFDGECEEYFDPREAVERAIKIAGFWKESEPMLEIGIARGYTGGMTMPFTPSDIDSLKIWAQETYESLPHCCGCGEILKEKVFYPDYAVGDADY